MKLKSTLIIVAIVLMAETAQAGNDWSRRGCRDREYLGGLVRVTYRHSPAYRPYYRPYYHEDRYYYPRQSDGIRFSDQQEDLKISSTGLSSLFGGKKLVREVIDISRESRQAPPPTFEDMETQVARIKAMGAEKQRRGQEEIPVETKQEILEEAIKILELELKKIELQKKLEEAKKK